MNHRISRRLFVAGVAAGVAGFGAERAKLKIGVTDWNLRLTGKLDAIALAKSLGFEGVQVSIGRNAVDGKMPMDDAPKIASFVAEAKSQAITIDGTCLDILHVNCLKNDKLAEKWISDSIRITKALGAKVILLPFFGRCSLTNQSEIDMTAAALKNLAPEAEKAGVILGLENTISAADNLRILDRVQSPAVLVYYDIGNSTNGGFDIENEIRDLKAERICQFHFKDNPNYLGDGKVDLIRVLRAIDSIGYRGFANLETDAPSKDVAADMRRNLGYVRGAMAQSGLTAN